MAIKSIPDRARNETIRIRFVKNKAYDGTDYGPSYSKQVADVKRYWARQFLRSGVAVLATEADTDSAPKRKRNRIAKSPKGCKRTPPNEIEPKTDADALPEDFPARDELLAAGVKTLSAARELSAEQLIAIKGIGEVTAREIQEALAEDEDDDQGDAGDA